MFNSPHAVPSHNSAADRQLAMRRAELWQHCRGCRWLSGDPLASGLCRFYGCVLSAESSFWRLCDKNQC